MLATGGEAVFARYAFPPNDLGHCGPPGSEVLLAAGSGAAVGPDVAERAAAFDGAWPYLRLLAAVAGSGELDAAVVTAYWLGGGLVDQVDVAEFAATVLRDFAGQPGVADRLAAAPGLLTPGPSHAFHVFVVYPWVSLLGSGGDVPRRVLDSCRVRWGTVESVDGDDARRPVAAPDLGRHSPVVGRGAAADRQLVARRARVRDRATAR